MAQRIERRVKKLVEALNSLPCVKTISSCGGHKAPGEYQLPADSFYVDFCLEETAMAWESLARIIDAAQETDSLNINITAWLDGCVRFDLRGTGGADPDQMAAHLVRNTND